MNRNLTKTRRYADLTVFEFEESPGGGQMAVENAESTLSPAERLFVIATSLLSDHALEEWQKLPQIARSAGGELRNAAAKRIEDATTNNPAKYVDDANLSIALTRWNEMMVGATPDSRTALVSQIAVEVQHLG